MSGFEHVQTVIAENNSSSFIEITDIPQDGNELHIYINLVSTNTAGLAPIVVQFNGVASDYQMTYVRNTPSSYFGASSQGSTAPSMQVGYGGYSSKQFPGIAMLKIANYTSSGIKPLTFSGGVMTNSTAQFNSFLFRGAGTWDNASGIESIKIYDNYGGNIDTGSKISLFKVIY